MKSRSIKTGIFTVIPILLVTACSFPASLTAKVNTALAQTSATETPVIPAPAPQIPVAAQPGLIAAYEGTLEYVYTQVNPSVVNIRVVQQDAAASIDPNQFPFFSMPGSPQDQTPQYSQVLGSGFVLDQLGHIITNNHVVDGAQKVEVTFADGATVPATVVGKDPDSDLAVLKVEATAENLHPVQFADSNQVKVGQMAIAIGNPFGLEGTMTVGIVSALGRTLPASETPGANFSIPDIIQTDAPINPGNSGGVLVDDQGQVIGVTAAIESPVRANAGIGFVIPSALVQKVVSALIKDGKFEHPYLGISMTNLTPDLAKEMNLKTEQRGTLVIEVVSGGPADKAGLRGSDSKVTIDGQGYVVGGDVVIFANDTPINKMDDLIAFLSNQGEVGKNVNLTVLRNGKEVKVEVTLSARPQKTETAASNQPQPTSGGVYLGIQGLPLNTELNKAMNLPEDTVGVLVEQIVNGSPADQAGLRGSYKPVDLNGKSTLVGGDVIMAVDGQSVTTVTELHDLLQQYKAGDQVTLTVLRDGKSMKVTATLAEQPGQ